MKDIKLKLISELMKNSKKSDRELAKVIGVSQPTFTRTRSRLEKEGYIKEYTLIPDFRKLGFEIMAFTFINFAKGTTAGGINETRNAIRKFEKEFPAAILMAVIGMGLGYERLVVSLHESYSSFMKHLTMIKQLPNVDMEHVESFVVSLAEEHHYQPLTLSTIANFLSKQRENKE